MEQKNTFHQKPIDVYIKEVQELAKTMPIIEPIEIKPKRSIGEKIMDFFKKFKK